MSCRVASSRRVKALRILVVSQYFPPEAGATQNRLGTFVSALAARGHRVTVICEQPCHPAGVFQPGFGNRPVLSQHETGVTIHRLWVAASPVKTRGRRLAFYGSFALGAGAAGACVRRADVVLASSPPLPAAITTAAIAHGRRIPLVLDIRDIWPAAAEALGELSDGPLLRAFERAERRVYQQASAVTATTLPFCRHVDSVAGRKLSVHLPNGALDELVALSASKPPRKPPFVVGYAGNFGIAQGLGIAMDAAERLRYEGVRFVLLGAGPLDAELRAQVDALSLDNVELRPGIPVSEVGAFLQSCHALLVPLRDNPVLDDFIPSKLYDAMAVGRPALVATRGEAAELTRQTGSGLVVGPEDGAALADAVRRLIHEPGLGEELGRAGRQAAAGMARSRQVDLLEQVLDGAASS